MMKNILLLLLSIGTMACTASEKAQPEPEKPTNIIFLIGDGMGLSAVSTGFYFGDQPSVFNRFHQIGLQQTSSATHKVTDSAASGTALATGKKTYNGAIGVDTTKTSVQNIAELVASMGWSTGVVATSTISHATPASFYAHVVQRSMEEEIAVQLLNSEIDFFAGGGRDKFNVRSDSTDLLLLAVDKGFTIDTTGLADPGTLIGDQKYGFLTEAGAMPPMIQGRGDFLPEATSLAIGHLSQNQKGFFLMVEGSQIDWAGHANNSEYLVREMLDFEKVIAAAMDFAEKDGNTLVVVTADHETGGFTLGPKTGETDESGYSDYSAIEPVFATGQHSATLIPVLAFGPGAEEFKGIYQNTEIYHKMAALAQDE
ncbi:MAG: alkaline phosphatase [Bacteroidales bacterium]|nr:alkaline phosphatase [Bacteroidales bacterium]